MTKLELHGLPLKEYRPISLPFTSLATITALGQEVRSCRKNLRVSQSSTHMNFSHNYYLPRKNETKKTLIFSVLLDVQCKVKRKKNQQQQKRPLQVCVCFVPILIPIVGMDRRGLTTAILSSI